MEYREKIEMMNIRKLVQNGTNSVDVTQVPRKKNKLCRRKKMQLMHSLGRQPPESDLSIQDVAENGIDILVHM